VAIGHLTGRGLVEALRLTIGQTLDAEWVPQIDVRKAPKIRAHRGYSFAKMDSTSDPRGRKRQGAWLLEEHRVTVRYCHRLDPHDEDDARLDALDRIDQLKTAFMLDTDTGRNFNPLSFAKTELHVSGWLVFDLSLRLQTHYQLQTVALAGAPP